MENNKNTNQKPMSASERLRQRHAEIKRDLDDTMKRFDQNISEIEDELRYIRSLKK